MARVNRVMSLKSFVHAVRLALRPGGPSLGERAAALPRLVRATFSGRYPGTSTGRLLLIAVAAAYLVSPVDVVPEMFLGLFGLADDALVAGWIAAQLVEETEGFLAWERGPETAGHRPPEGPTVPGHVVP
jgi:uncharacterized membrane protein YkvA (DUF1232 family)